MQIYAALYSLGQSIASESHATRTALENTKPEEAAEAVGRMLGHCTRTVELLKQLDPACVEKVGVAHHDTLQALGALFPDPIRKPDEVLEGLESSIRIAAKSVPHLDVDALVKLVRKPAPKAK